MIIIIYNVFFQQDWCLLARGESGLRKSSGKYTSTAGCQRKYTKTIFKQPKQHGQSFFCKLAADFQNYRVNTIMRKLQQQHNARRTK